MSEREPCLCCECKYWSSYIDQHGISWGRCLKDKPAFSDMQKCEEFIYYKEVKDELFK